MAAKAAERLAESGGESRSSAWAPGARSWPCCQRAGCCLRPAAPSPWPPSLSASACTPAPPAPASPAVPEARMPMPEMPALTGSATSCAPRSLATPNCCASREYAASCSRCGFPPGLHRRRSADRALHRIPRPPRKRGGPAARRGALRDARGRRRRRQILPPGSPRAARLPARPAGERPRSTAVSVRRLRDGCRSWRRDRGSGRRGCSRRDRAAASGNAGVMFPLRSHHGRGRMHMALMTEHPSVTPTVRDL